MMGLAARLGSLARANRSSQAWVESSSQHSCDWWRRLDRARAQMGTAQATVAHDGVAEESACSCRSICNYDQHETAEVQTFINLVDWSHTCWPQSNASLAHKVTPGAGRTPWRKSPATGWAPTRWPQAVGVREHPVQPDALFFLQHSIPIRRVSPVRVRTAVHSARASTGG
jgi:hypothetical protein